MFWLCRACQRAYVCACVRACLSCFQRARVRRRARTRLCGLLRFNTRSARDCCVIPHTPHRTPKKPQPYEFSADVRRPCTATRVGACAFRGYIKNVCIYMAYVEWHFAGNETASGRVTSLPPPPTSHRNSNGVVAKRHILSQPTVSDGTEMAPTHTTIPHIPRDDLPQQNISTIISHPSIAVQSRCLRTRALHCIALHVCVCVRVALNNSASQTPAETFGQTTDARNRY